MKSTRQIRNWSRLVLDLPSEMSRGLGRSIVQPHESVEPTGTPQWVAEARQRMGELREDAWTNCDWHRFVFLHDRTNRWRALKAISASIGPTKMLAELFRKVWVDSEEIHRERVIVRSLIQFILRFNLQQHLFSPEDRIRFEEMPDPLKIYRGAKTWNRYGMSWTSDVDSAVYFATHHYEEGCACSLNPDDFGFVMEKTVPKSEIVFYTSDRKEDELILPGFEKGSKSPEGMLWVSQCAGPEAFSRELERQRGHLDPTLVELAERWLALAGFGK